MPKFISLVWRLLEYSSAHSSTQLELYSSLSVCSVLKGILLFLLEKKNEHFQLVIFCLHEFSETLFKQTLKLRRQIANSNIRLD